MVWGDVWRVNAILRLTSSIGPAALTITRHRNRECTNALPIRKNQGSRPAIRDSSNARSRDAVHREILRAGIRAIFHSSGEVPIIRIALADN
jgi:hypothetical protein